MQIKTREQNFVLSNITYIRSEHNDLRQRLQTPSPNKTNEKLSPVLDKGFDMDMVEEAKR